jgi:Ni/Co efflux regulator RcnB
MTDLLGLNYLNLVLCEYKLVVLKFSGVVTMEMKKILGILLAVCFLMSVTAAAVSAGNVDHTVGNNKDKDKDKDKKDYKKEDKKEDKKKDDGKKWGDDRHKKVEFKWKCHTEYKRVLVKIIYKHHGKPIKIYKWKAFKVCKKVPVYNHR